MVGLRVNEAGMRLAGWFTRKRKLIRDSLVGFRVNEAVIVICDWWVGLLAN